jgi:hypothetical protein
MQMQSLKQTRSPPPHSKTATTPTIPPTTPASAPAVCTAAPPVDFTLAGETSCTVADAPFNTGPAAPPVGEIPCLITLASAEELPLLTTLAGFALPLGLAPSLFVELPFGLAITPILVALAPHTQ